VNKRWTGKKITTEQHIIDDKHHDQLLEELAEIIYSYICQLDQVKLRSTDSSQKLKRTGTDD